MVDGQVQEKLKAKNVAYTMLVESLDEEDNDKKRSEASGRGG